MVFCSLFCLSMHLPWPLPCSRHWFHFVRDFFSVSVTPKWEVRSKLPVTINNFQIYAVFSSFSICSCFFFSCSICCKEEFHIEDLNFEIKATNAERERIQRFPVKEFSFCSSAEVVKYYNLRRYTFLWNIMLTFVRCCCCFLLQKTLVWTSVSASTFVRALVI